MQKDIFLQGEGDAWFKRNPSNRYDPLLEKIIKLKPESVLEMGCADGERLFNIRKEIQCSVMGLDPSKEAIERGRLVHALNVQVGTADDYIDKKFDMIIFGFCLYLCDREDLFQIACNADKMLNKGGYIVIHDFKPPHAYANNYHHFEGLKSYKMNYANMFTWNPAYTLISSEIISEDLSPDNRIGIDIIMKG